MASCSSFLKEDFQVDARLGSAMVWLLDEFRGQSTVYGKISVAIYSFIIIFGSLTTVMGMIAPIASADCMADPFSPDHPKKGQVDQLVWFKAMGRTSGALGTTFLLAVYMLGHNTKSCLLLFVWGFLSYLNFAVVIPNDFVESGGSEAGQTCMQNVRTQVAAFAVLEAVCVLCAWLEERSRPCRSNVLLLNSATEV
ncbi:unnamed protein product [Symbiodinium necroappetens]|uniref:Uncharacterized protein n=1 Tax=Symbiodinium necroappetens TaxID=1628268 RepID=A0A812ZPM7_9DINO|nr:unnamed protein product [Symbiodinium necroappetens]